MRHLGIKHALCLALVALAALAGVGATHAARLSAQGSASVSASAPASQPQASQPQAADSTGAAATPAARYPVAPTVPILPQDLEAPHPADLRTPSNLTQDVEFDYRHGRYIVHTRVGDTRLDYGIPMTRQEYMDYTERRMRAAWFRDQNRKAFDEAQSDDAGLLDWRWDIGAADKIFGKGGIRAKIQGSASLSTGFKRNRVDNPTLSERARDQRTFDFDENIQVNMNASIGSKMQFNFNYNTEATFDFDANQLKLNFGGEEDDIIRSLEAGNVSMTTGSSLISGGAALFGVKAGLRFGRLNVTALLSKQESTSKTVSSRGGATRRQFEIMADQYDENRHFFLAHYFYDTYDQNMSHLPLVASGVEITKIEVWVTNKRADYQSARNIVAFMDLGEPQKIYNSHWQPLTASEGTHPQNKANTLYTEVTTQYAALRDITQVSTALAPLEAYGITGGADYEKIESARLLSPSEYTLNTQLGYISLKSRLDDDMTLAVAFQYTRGGRTYQVGEFSTDVQGASNAEAGAQGGTSTGQALVVKLLRSASPDPHTPLWRLMMKNVYALGASSLRRENFTLAVQYMSDTLGVYADYLTEGPIARQLLVRVMGLDRLNATQESHPDGQFDWVEGYTVQPTAGRIIFPVVEPFGAHLAQQLGSEALASRYCYPELYDSTLTAAQQVAEKNKFRLRGEYSASSGSEIDLGAMNVARGSVRVTAGGTQLVENSDYTVDYTMGVVTILNENIIESGTPISVSLEDQSDYSLQRKTLMGLDLQYEHSKDLTLGATVMHLSEKPLTKKVANTEIPISNTIYGFNLKWNHDFMWLTNAVGAIPWIDATAPSNINVTAEFAQLVAGHSPQIGGSGNVYLDDFENSETPTDISSPSAWQLASTPYDDSPTALFPEAALSNNTDYGKNRALFSWYTVERLFTSQSSSLTPAHIKNDLEQLSDHRVRQVNYDEIYPNKELSYGETGILNVLNLSFYPHERGPYNVDAEGIGPDGRLLHPERRWGGMMRALDVTNFENANYEYIEFWLMDPFASIDDASAASAMGGDLYFNLGEISEDILKDGMKAFENGLAPDGDTTYTATTVWGRVARRTSSVYAFDNTTASHRAQDVGLDGLATADEHDFPTYRNYVEQVRQRVDPDVLAQWQHDPFSPINDPAGDNYHFYRGSDYDAAHTSILDRYKYFRGTEGNSPATADSGESYSTAAKATPDVEDINGDNTLNEYERYFQYHISLRPEDMQVGRNYIEAVTEARPTLRNGQRPTVRWYQFRIPLREFDKRIGNIQNFKSIRFMRIFMTGWHHEQTLRLASLELVRSDWRTYTASSLADRGYAVSHTASLATSTVNIEENAGSTPVNYVLPPGIDRIVDPGQSTAVQLNEQAMVLAVSDLEPHDAVAVYKNSGIDMRRYERLQLFVHAEALADNLTDLRSGELSLFIRLGADYQDNYYEYEVPLHLTPAGTYNRNSDADRRKVWPDANMIDLSLSHLTRLKQQRNAAKQQALSAASFTTPFSDYDPDRRQNKITILGNPTLGDVSVIMIGVRNNGRTVKSGRIWVNELRMNGIDESGGWAAKANATLRVSDLATLAAAGSFTSAGFGSIEQSSAERRLTDDYEYTLSGQTDLGRWIPKQVKLAAPFYYARGKAVSTPKYDPYNDDLLLDETLDTYTSASAKDSIRQLTQTVEKTSSLALSGVKFNVKSKKSKPWDPANITMAYSQNLRRSHDPTTEYERNNTYKASLNYSWTPFFTPIKPWAPATSSRPASAVRPAPAPGKAADKGKTPASSRKLPKVLTDFQINWLPNTISLASQWNRTYHEEQLRNIETYESDFRLPVSYSKTFTWMRQTAIAWDLTKTLKLNFNSATNARIDEPDTPVNKNLYPDEYEAWKDTIMQQLWKLGTPISYNQTFDAAWQVPISAIPALNWTQASLKYKSSYQWDRGTVIDEHTRTGNTLQNSATWQGDTRLNLEQLYNKSKFLKKANDRFKPRTTTRTVTSRGKSAAPAKKTSTTSRQARKYEKEITLGATDVDLTHRLGTRRLLIAAKDTATGKAFPIRFKKVDENTIRIHGIADTAQAAQRHLSITVTPDKPLDDLGWYKSLQVVSRALMMVRSVQVGYRYQQDTYLPSFRPDVGDFYGQNNGGGAMKPGLGFAFGFDGGERFTRKAIERDWLIVNDSLTTPAVYSWTKDLTYQAVLEPLPGLKVNLTGAHKHNEKQSHQFMFADMAIQRSGAFQMTTVALGSAFGGTKSGRKYRSDAFDRFLANRQVVYNRLLTRYEGTRYPTGGFMQGYEQLAGTRYEGVLGASRLNSGDVLVPAFLAAYMGGDPTTVSTSPFPAWYKALPNWKATYDGLINLIPWLGKHFKTFSLSHAYTCTYNVGSYQTYTNYAENEQGLGFTLDVTADVPVPSSEFDIQTVTLTESFAPLAGINFTTHNNISGRAEYKQTRSLSLNMAAAQLVESVSKDITVGLGYKVEDFATKMGLPTGKDKSVKHDLNLKFDLTHKNQVALLRKIEEQYSEATSGNKAWTFRFQADYQFSKMLQMKLYYDKQINTPLISTSYPTSNADFGITMTFSLTR